MIYAIGKPGEPVRIYVDVPNLEALAANIGEGEDAVLVNEVGDCIISEDGLAVEPRLKPIQEQQGTLWLKVKAARESAESGGCNTAWGLVQTDARSEARIAGLALQAAISAMSGAPFSAAFRFADNSNVTLGREALLSLNSTVQAHIQACRARGQALREQIFAEGITAAELAAIDITAGWPSNT